MEIVAVGTVGIAGMAIDPLKGGDRGKDVDWWHGLHGCE